VLHQCLDERRHPSCAGGAAEEPDQVSHRQRIHMEVSVFGVLVCPLVFLFVLVIEALGKYSAR